MKDIEQRLNSLPYGISKSGIEAGFDVIEKGDTILYLYRWSAWGGDIEKSLKQIREIFPEAEEVDFVEDDEDESNFFALRFENSALKLSTDRGD